MNYEDGPIIGVVVKKLKVVADERGFLMEMIRSDDKFFEGFGQVYMTTCYPGIVKAWHYHKLQDDNFCVVKGMARVGLFDNREGSESKGRSMDLVIGENNPCVVHIPTGVLHGFKAIGNDLCYLINLVKRPYDRETPDEFRVKWNDETIQFKWKGEVDG